MHAFATPISKTQKHHPYENQNQNKINTNKFIYPKSPMKLKHITKYDKYKNNNESETQIQNNLKSKIQNHPAFKWA
jgi:hypothetical protein